MIYLCFGMNQEGDLRRHVRAAKSSTVQIIWKDRQGTDKFVQGRIVDVSEAGIRVEITEPLEKQTYVTLQSPGLGLHGTASVKSCARRGLKYSVGLEFSAGLKWTPKS